MNKDLPIQNILKFKGGNSGELITSKRILLQGWKM